MESVDRKPSSTAGTADTASDPAGEGYQPPEVSWEEEFAPVADSLCDPTKGDICPDG